MNIMKERPCWLLYMKATVQPNAYHHALLMNAEKKIDKTGCVLIHAKDFKTAVKPRPATAVFTAVIE